MASESSRFAGDTNLNHDRRLTRYGASNTSVTARWLNTPEQTLNVLNVSERGIAIESPEPISEETTIYLRHKEDAVRGIVAWCRRIDANNSAYRVGIHLKDNRVIREAFLNSLGIAERIADRRTSTDADLNQSDPARRFDDVLKTFDVLSPTSQVVYRRKQERRRDGDGSQNRRRSGEDRRAQAVKPPEIPNPLKRSITQVLFCLRDLLIFFLPASITQRYYRDASFAFVTHPRDLDDIKRHFPFARWIPKKVLGVWLKYQWPVIGARITNFPLRGRAIQKGWLIFCPLTAKQMIKDRKFATRRVATAVRFADKVNAKIVGLGAFTSIVTHDGLDLIGKVNVGVTTGNALSAATAIQNAIKAAELTGRKIADANVAIVGAAGNVGSACARVINRNAKKLLLIDINRRGLDRLSEELGGVSDKLQQSTDIASIGDSDIVIVVTNTPGAIVRAHHLKKGAIAIDCAQPKNVSEQVPLERPDVIVIESAVLKMPKLLCDFDLGIGAGEALGCMAETIVLDAIDWHRDFSIGQLTTTHVKKILAAAKLVGADISYFRHSKGFVTENSINHVRGDLLNE